jgi:hypothetical protein
VETSQNYVTEPNYAKPLDYRAQMDIHRRVASLNISEAIASKLVYDFTQHYHLPVRPCNESNRLQTLKLAEDRKKLPAYEKIRSIAHGFISTFLFEEKLHGIVNNLGQHLGKFFNSSRPI